jgi:hypothetical protein
LVKSGVCNDIIFSNQFWFVFKSRNSISRELKMHRNCRIASGTIAARICSAPRLTSAGASLLRVARFPGQHLFVKKNHKSDLPATAARSADEAKRYPDGTNHTPFGTNHTQTGTNHSQPKENQSQAGTNHSKLETNHSQPGANHSQVRAKHSQVRANHTQLGTN